MPQAGAKKPADKSRSAGSRPYPTFVFTKSFCKSQFPHKFVNLSFIITDMQKLTDLCGN